MTSGKHPRAEDPLQSDGAAAASAERSPEPRERLSGDEAEFVGSTPSEFAKFIGSESECYADLPPVAIPIIWQEVRLQG